MRLPSYPPSLEGDGLTASCPTGHRVSGAGLACGPSAIGPRSGRNTPLVELRSLQRGFSPRVVCWRNWKGSTLGVVKDRPAVWMLRAGLRSGALRPGKTIIDSTSGNTGIALALAGAVLGYPVELVMPANVSVERSVSCLRTEPRSPAVVRSRVPTALFGSVERCLRPNPNGISA